MQCSCWWWCASDWFVGWACVVTQDDQAIEGHHDHDEKDHIGSQQDGWHAPRLEVGGSLDLVTSHWSTAITDSASTWAVFLPSSLFVCHGVGMVRIAAKIMQQCACKRGALSASRSPLPATSSRHSTETRTHRPPPHCCQNSHSILIELVWDEVDHGDVPVNILTFWLSPCRTLALQQMELCVSPILLLGQAR